jgi:hypothetical protein
MKKLVLAIIVFCSMFQTAIAQSEDEREDIYLARVGLRVLELEMEEALSLWFTDADTGKPLQGALVAIEDIGSSRTDSDGLAIFPVVDDGKYAFIFQKDGYITIKNTFFVSNGTIFQNKFSIPKLNPIEHIKIILDWSSTPADLDAHLTKDNSYHISYRNTKTSSDKTAWLDKDSLNGYGPETITVTQVDKKTVYHYFVHNYSNRNTANDSRLSQSKAAVHVYINNKFHASYPVETGKTGTTWHVFDIVNGQIKPTNRFE